MTNQTNSYTPIEIPPEISVFKTEPGQLGVGKSGKVGILQLRLEGDAERKKTIIREQYCKVPLCIQRAMYLEESLPAMAYVYIVSPSGGILQGDRYQIDITLSNSAIAHITTQGATRIYKMERNFGTQMVNIVVEEGSYLEYIPDQIIPFRNSRFFQPVHLKIHDNATLIYSEMLAPGRVASGESLEYEICYIKTMAINQQNKLTFTDMVKLEPKKENLRLDGILSKFDVVGTTYIITRVCYVEELKGEINSVLDKIEGEIVGGASILPDKKGIIVRLLGTRSAEVRNAIFEIVRASRKRILGARFSPIRKA